MMNNYQSFAPYINNGTIKKRTLLNISFFLSNSFQSIRKKIAQIKLPKIRLRFLVIAALCLFVLGGLYYFYFYYLVPRFRPPKESNTKFSQVISIGKTLTFPAITSKGEYEGEISLTVVSAEKTNEVLVKNNPIRTNPDKFFLIINLELENESTDKLGLVSSDLIRLVVGEDGRKIAPDLHNKQVLISPISIKTDKIGFVVNASEKVLLVLELGEFYRTKKVREKINLEF